MSRQDEQPTLEFASVELLDAWLETQAGDSTGIWLKVAKKGSGIPSVTIEEALQLAQRYAYLRLTVSFLSATAADELDGLVNWHESPAARKSTRRSSLRSLEPR